MNARATTPDLTGDLSTASVSDALDSLGIPGSLHGIGALRQGQRRKLGAGFHPHRQQQPHQERTGRQGRLSSGVRV